MASPACSPLCAGAGSPRALRAQETSIRLVVNRGVSISRILRSGDSSDPVVKGHIDINLLSSERLPSLSPCGQSPAGPNETGGKAHPPKTKESCSVSRSPLNSIHMMEAGESQALGLRLKKDGRRETVLSLFMEQRLRRGECINQPFLRTSSPITARSSYALGKAKD
jgi:hypothetical protein